MEQKRINRTTLERLGAEPWFISEAGIQQAKAILESTEIQAPAMGIREAFPHDDKGPLETLWGDIIERPGMLDGVDIFTVPIRGVMVKGGGFVDMLLGYTTHEFIEAGIREGLASEAESILLLIDSPGGTALGTPELASLISQVNEEKPVYSFSDSLVASAAEYATAGASMAFGTPSSIRGSIGAAQIHVSYAGMLEQSGINVDVIRSGENKMAGNEFEDLTDNQRALKQENIDSMAEEFKDWMRIHRGERAEDPGALEARMDGRTFPAREARELGIIDEIVPNLTAVIDAIS